MSTTVFGPLSPHDGAQWPPIQGILCWTQSGAQEGLFKAGELFERTIHTSKGSVGMLAEVVIIDKVLHLQDVVIYGQGQLSGLLRELLQAKTQLIHEARAAGFDTLRITGRRVPGSSSAHPGKTIDVTIDLTKYAGE